MFRVCILFLESFHSIVEMFRISLETAGYTDVKFSTGGVLPRRKSKIPLLDVPKVRIWMLMQSIKLINDIIIVIILGYAT